jgi:energy-coupling factor transport system permease protein
MKQATGKTRLDPRTRIIALGSLTALAALTESWFLLAVAGILLFVWALREHIPPARLLRNSGRLFWFGLAIVVANILTTDGNVILRIGSLTGTMEGLLRGAMLFFKLILFLWCSMILVHSTTPAELVFALEKSLGPLRARLGFLIMLLTITFNLVPRMAVLARQIALNFSARGIDIDSGLPARVRFLSSAAIPLLASSSRSASLLGDAMEARCYDPSAARTRYHDRRMGRRDYLTIVSMIAIAGLALFFSDAL